MSYQDTNILHYRVPYKLLRLPEYSRWFHATTLGAAYSLLSSKIYRRKTRQLKYYTEGGWVTELAKMYDEGKLACYFTDEEIMDAMYFDSRRSVQEIRKTLEELKLIKVTPFGKGYIYQLGYVVRHVDEDGYSVGTENEAHYFDRWYSYATSDDQQVVGAFRYYLASNLASEKKRVVILEELGKVFPGVAQNFSILLNLREGDSERATQVKPPVAPPLREVNRREVKKDIPKAAPSGDLTEFSDALKKGLNGLKTAKMFRALVAQGSSRDQLTKMILDSVHPSHRYLGYPLFSKQLDSVEKTPETMVIRLWDNLREDVLGVVPVQDSASDAKRTRAVITKLLTEYPLEQIVWTMKQVTKVKSEVEFLVLSPATMKKVISGKALLYKRWLENERVRLEKESAQTESEQTTEQERLAYLKTYATPVEVVQRVVARSQTLETASEEEDTYDYWMNKAQQATKLTTKLRYEERAKQAAAREEML